MGYGEELKGGCFLSYIKLQLGCMVIIMYIVVTYIKAIRKNKGITYNKIFGALLFVVPLAVLFDGATAWSVNSLETVPIWMNRLLHLGFFLSMDTAMIITAIYMYDQILGINSKKMKTNVLMIFPFVISVILIIVGIPYLTFVRGEVTNFSRGFSVYVCFASLGLYYGALLFLVISRHKYLPNSKIAGTLSFIIIPGVLLTIQLIFEEVLISAISPTLLLLGIYVDFENPALRRLTIFNKQMVENVAGIVENRDNDTGGHINRTRSYVMLILNKMRTEKKYRNIITNSYIIQVVNAAPLHDIGKISTSDSILHKPGKLTKEEYEEMKMHSVNGANIIKEIFKGIDDPVFEKIAYEVARYHHEKYNGKGYPDGLAGDQIPLHARIMAVADVFDAVSQPRVYRAAMTRDESFKIIEEGIGTDFDPNIAKIFLDSREEVEELLNELSDQAVTLKREADL